MSQLVAEVKEKLDKELPLGKYGRDDQELILWFLKNQKYSVQKTVNKLNKAIRWRCDFGVSQLSEESLKNVAESGEAYVYDHLDVYNRPVLMVEAAKHIPGKNKPCDDEKLCVFLIEKALNKLPDGVEKIVLIIDLQGVGTKNVDLKFSAFMREVFCCYYPGRLGDVLCVEAPFIMKPIWQIVKPFVKPFDSLAKFCSAKNVREEYFTADAVPTNFTN